MREIFKEHWLKFMAGLTTAGVVAAIKHLWSRVNREVKEQATLKNGVLALLHDRLYQACQHYIHVGTISADDLKNLEHLFEAYQALGGNGTCETLYKRVCEIALRKIGG